MNLLLEPSRSIDINSPLQIIRPRILVLLIRTERAGIIWTLMNQSMPLHLVLTLKAFAVLAVRATFDWAEMVPGGAMNILVRAEQILRLKGRGSAARMVAFVHVGMRHTRRSRQCARCNVWY